MDRDSFSSKVSEIAHFAMLEEVSVNSKPGLVCPDSKGSHNDMDYDTFVNSADALIEYFYRSTYIGCQHAHIEHQQVMNLLRIEGLEAENKMYDATKGVNTHKGIIFSLGIITATCGRFFTTKKKLDIYSLLDDAAKFIPHLVEYDLMPLRISIPNRKLTVGERLFLEYGVTGIRGEASRGFPSILKGYEKLEYYMEFYANKTLSKNDAYLNTLLYLMSFVDDTNLLHRGKKEGLDLAKQFAAKVLSKGGSGSKRGNTTLNTMKKLFVENNLSPGGSADMLCIVIFLRELSALNKSYNR